MGLSAIQLHSGTIHLGDCLQSLRSLPAGSVHCCITSPPYWGLRSYQTDPQVWGGDPACDHQWETHVRPAADGTRTLEGNAALRAGYDGSVSATLKPTVTQFCTLCGAWLGELGSEPTPDLFVAHLVEVFREVWRVLRDDGTCWVNLGDGFSSGGRTHQRDADAKWKAAEDLHRRVDTPPGLKPKDLLMMPARVALALQAPYQKPLCISADVDRAWLAALVDGEGCIGIRRFKSYRAEKRQVYQDGFVAYVSIGNNDVELLEQCVKITGLGSVAVKDRPSVDRRGINSRRTYYGWRLDGNAAISVITAIYPFLVAKRRQAILAYTLDRSNKDGRGARGNGPVPPEFQEKRELLKALIGRCNQREDDISIPEWCQEPTVEVEPGWYLRSAIPWVKRNPKPESCTDRLTCADETVFLLAKSPRYYYDRHAVLQPASAGIAKRLNQANLFEQTGGFKQEQYQADFPGQKNNERRPQEVLKALAKGNPTQRALRTSDFALFAAREAVDDAREALVDAREALAQWQEVVGVLERGGCVTDEDTMALLVTATEPCREAHFATYPRALIRPCLQAGTSEVGACEACGAPWERVFSTSYTKSPAHGSGSVVGRHDASGQNNFDGAGMPRLARVDRTEGWRPTCTCGKQADCPRCAGRGTKLRNPLAADRDHLRKWLAGKRTTPRGKPRLPRTHCPACLGAGYPREEWHPTVPCTVLDPFLGSGTTALVAEELGRRWLGCELNPEYAEIAVGRLTASRDNHVGRLL